MNKTVISIILLLMLAYLPTLGKAQTKHQRKTYYAGGSFSALVYSTSTSEASHSTTGYGFSGQFGFIDPTGFGLFVPASLNFFSNHGTHYHIWNVGLGLRYILSLDHSSIHPFFSIAYSFFGIETNTNYSVNQIGPGIGAGFNFMVSKKSSVAISYMHYWLNMYKNKKSKNLNTSGIDYFGDQIQVSLIRYF